MFVSTLFESNIEQFNSTLNGKNITVYTRHGEYSGKFKKVEPSEQTGVFLLHFLPDSSDLENVFIYWTTRIEINDR